MMSGKFPEFTSCLGGFIATACPVPCPTPVVSSPYCGCSSIGLIGVREGGRIEGAGDLIDGVVKPDFGL
jgi:hypothetical protein